MSKYEPLWKHISENGSERLTFEEISGTLGFPVDHSFLSFKKELIQYGYSVKKIHMKEKFIEFTAVP